MREETGVEYDLFPPFLAAVRSIYHEQNKYHNFQHAVDVLQAVYSFLVQAECVPPITILLEDDKVVPEPGLTLPLPGSSSTPRKRPTSSTSSSSTWSRVNRRAGLVQQVLENRDLLALCIAAIGHDVGHPGLSNAFMVSMSWTIYPIRIELTACSSHRKMHGRRYPSYTTTNRRWSKCIALYSFS